MNATAALERSILIGSIVKKILERLEQERAEAAAALVGLPQPVSFQNHQEEILRKVLRVLIRIATAADVGKNRVPVSSAKRRQRLRSLLLVAFGVRPSEDHTPVRGGEHPRLGFHIHRPIEWLSFASSTSLKALRLRAVQPQELEHFRSS